MPSLDPASMTCDFAALAEAGLGLHRYGLFAIADFLSKLFDTGDFPPRWQCGDWTSGHAWLHILSDMAIFAAYASIPILLIFFILKRKDVPFLPLFWLFALFILSCGIVHLVESTLFWHPWYRLSGVLKLVTACVSWVTVIALIPVMPKAFALPGLAKLNARLTREVADRQKAELALRERANELEKMNQELAAVSRATVGREDRIIELKREVNKLLVRLGEEPRYSTQFDSLGQVE